ncbi:MAG: glycosyltransferase family 2 protein [Acidobacteriota bacterium]
MKISVVMSVYNGEETLEATLDSLAGQTQGDYELIIVDDGSEDTTPEILLRYADRDPRIRVITQKNAGLTRALILGCEAAKAPVIARHDCGDRSDPQRLERELEMLTRDDHILVGCATRYLAPAGELLYIASSRSEEIQHGLASGDANTVRGLPSHGCAMFLRNAYEAVGGYRAEFYFAQDLDLWIRLARLGTIGLITDDLYETDIEPRGVSSVFRTEQRELTSIMVALRDGGDSQALLQRASAIRPRRTKTKRGEAAGLYFIAKCLLARHDPRWRRYLFQALRAYPLHYRSWIALLTGR